MKTKLSVIIPCYNHGKYLPEALASVDKSSNRDEIEVIIINDGSDDELTNNYIASLDQRKYVIINQENLGLAKARNNGIMKAKSDYVLILDSDNYIEEIFILDFFDLIHRKVAFDALYGDARFFGEENKIQVQGEIDLLKLLNSNYIDACAIFNKSTLLKLNLYDDKMPFMGWEDWELWLKIKFYNYKALYNHKVYFNYRYRNNSMIRVLNNENYIETKRYLAAKFLSSNDNVLSLIDCYLFNYLSIKRLNKVFIHKIKRRVNYFLEFLKNKKT